MLGCTLKMYEQTHNALHHIGYKKCSRRNICTGKSGLIKISKIDGH